MATFTQILYQIVFSTKHANNTMVLSESKKLYSYIWGVLKNKKCTLYQLNGTENQYKPERNIDELREKPAGTSSFKNI